MTTPQTPGPHDHGPQDPGPTLRRRRFHRPASPRHRVDRPAPAESSEPRGSASDETARAVRPPVRAGDRLLLDARATGLTAPRWAVVERVEHVLDPGPLPWNQGRERPFRVGFRVDDPAVDGTFGVIWLDPSGADAARSLLAVRRSSS